MGAARPPRGVPWRRRPSRFLPNGRRRQNRSARSSQGGKRSENALVGSVMATPASGADGILQARDTAVETDCRHSPKNRCRINRRDRPSGIGKSRTVSHPLAGGMHLATLIRRGKP